MEPAADAPPSSAVTEQLSAHVSRLSFDDLDERSVTVAKHCLLDWFGVTLTAWRTPLVTILVDQALEDGGVEAATIIGQGRKATLEQAALINGSAAHALDYDDVHFDMQAHPSAPIAPAAFALAEQRRLSGRELLQGFAAGFELACRIGRLMGSSHYNHGWHATATFGALGAAGAAARILGLDGPTTATALGIAGSHAAGLKAVFGTMTKPLQVGRAAAVGVQAARLAARGMTSAQAILDVPQGFATTQSTSLDPQAALETPGSGFYLPKTMFKYHAACYLTHSSIEAVAALHRTHAIDPDAIASVSVVVDQDHLRICNIQSPATGLEMKFSLRAMTAMALLKRDTANDANFSDAAANDPQLIAIRDRISVDPRPTWGGSSSDVIIRMTTGEILRATHDVGIPATDLGAQEERLLRKFLSIAQPALSADAARELAQLCLNIDQVEDVSQLMTIAAAYPGTAHD